MPIKNLNVQDLRIRRIKLQMQTCDSTLGHIFMHLSFVVQASVVIIASAGSSHFLMIEQSSKWIDTPLLHNGDHYGPTDRQLV